MMSCLVSVGSVVLVPALIIPVLAYYCHLPHQATQDKVSNLLIFMIVSGLIAVELEDKNEETNQSTVPVLWLPIKMILKLTRLGLYSPMLQLYRPCFADYGTGNSSLTNYIWSLFESSRTL